MIDERTAELLVERLIRRIEEANIYFLNKMGASISKLRELTPTEAQQLIQILKYGDNYNEIIKEISKYTDLNIKDIEDIFYEYAKKDQMFYEKFYKYRDIPFTPFEDNIALKRQTRALTRIAKNEMYNFTRANVLGYTIRDLKGVPQFLGLKETYNRVLDEALLNVGQGKETFDSAMTRIMKDIGGSGLKTLEYESGRSVRLDSAVRMHLKGRLRELHNENQKIIGEEIDYDGYEISVHLNPAPDHTEAQGRQFSIEEFEKLNSGQEAVDYTGKVITLDHDGKNGYRPISEMNCYHYIFSIVLGVSKPEYSEEELQQISESNDEGFEYNGKHYTNYEGTQLQRSLERAIREQKDTQIFAKSSGNMELVAEAQKKITNLTKRYKEISDVSGLPTKMQRMKVSGYKRKNIKNINNKIQTTKNTKEYIKYDDNINEFKNNNPKVILKEKNDIINEWSADSGGYHSNTGIMKYMTEDKKIYGEHKGWEQGIKDIDNQIKGTLDENIMTYRTVQIPVKELKVGQIVDEDGFIATSLTRSKSVGAFNYGDAYSSTIEVEVDEGTRCLYIGDKTGHTKNEEELLFPPEYEIKIISKKIEYDSDGDYSRTIFKGKMIKKRGKE